MSNTNDFTLLPRFELREDQFRRYEQDLADACYASKVVDPARYAGKKKRTPSAHTLAVRLRDAKLAYRVYGYKSTLIPTGYDLENITVRETADGRVLLSNKKADIQRAVHASSNPSPSVVSNTNLTNIIPFNEANVLTLAKGLSARKIDGVHYIAYETPEQLAWLTALQQEMDVFVVVKEGYVEIN